TERTTTGDPGPPSLLSYKQLQIVLQRFRSLKLFEIVLGHVLIPLLDSKVPQHRFCLIKSGINVHLASAGVSWEFSRAANGVFCHSLMHNKFQYGRAYIASA